MENTSRNDTNLEKKVLAYCKNHHMFEKGDKVVLGVSGGADSVCLLFVLQEIKEELGVELSVVHLNHKIRKEAGEDAAFVERLCLEKQIPFYYEERDVKALSKEEKCSEEEAGRLARYASFEKIRNQINGDKIAVAHNGNDRAETMLFNLFRGSGITGLCGIQPVRDRIVRPLLCVERKEIESYLNGKGIPYQQDCTNETDNYTRNRIRHHILPFAEEEIAKGSVEHMMNAADILAQTEEYIEEVTRKLREDYVSKTPDKEEYVLEVRLAEEQPAFLAKRVILSVLKDLSPRQRDIGKVHVDDVYALLVKEGNREISLPFEINVKRSYEIIVLLRGQIEKDEGRSPVEISKEEWNLLKEGKEIRIPLGETEQILLRCIPKNTEEILKNPYTKWFDCDKIVRPLVVRSRKVGDYLSLQGKQEAMIHKSLKDYMINEKIPKEERDIIPLIAEENHILWLVGYRISEYYKVDEKTKNILEVQYVKTKE